MHLRGLVGFLFVLQGLEEMQMHRSSAVFSLIPNLALGRLWWKPASVVPHPLLAEN